MGSSREETITEPIDRSVNSTVYCCEDLHLLSAELEDRLLKSLRNQFTTYFYVVVRVLIEFY